MYGKTCIHYSICYDLLSNRVWHYETGWTRVYKDRAAGERSGRQWDAARRPFRSHLKHTEQKPDFPPFLAKTQNTFNRLQESATSTCSLLFAGPRLCPTCASLPPTFFCPAAVLIIDQMGYLSHTSNHHYLPNRISMLAGLRRGSFSHIRPVIGPIIKLEAFPRCASVNGACEKTGFSA